MPPWKLKPLSSGYSNVTGKPVATARTAQNEPENRRKKGKPLARQALAPPCPDCEDDRAEHAG
jgi:hypothetical protein